jgi:hypothetical protein
VSDAVIDAEGDLSGQAPDGGGDGCNDHRVEQLSQGIATEDDDRASFVKICEPDLAAAYKWGHDGPSA